MAWTYSDYDSYTNPRDKLARIDLLIQEVTDAIGADASSDAKSISFQSLSTLLADLRKRRAEIVLIPGANGSVAGGKSLARMTRARF